MYNLLYVLDSMYANIVVWFLRLMGGNIWKPSGEDVNAIRNANSDSGSVYTGLRSSEFPHLAVEIPATQLTQSLKWSRYFKENPERYLANIPFAFNL